MRLHTIPRGNRVCQIGDEWKEEFIGVWYNATGRMRDLISGDTDHTGRGLHHNTYNLSEESIADYFEPIGPT